MAVSKTERGLVIRYYLASVLGGRALWLIVLLAAEFLLLCMLNDLVFHSAAGFFVLGAVVWIALEIALTVLICYAIRAERMGLSGKEWASIEGKAQRARKAARDRGENSPAANFPNAQPGQKTSLAYSARRAAVSLGIDVPKPKTCVLALFLSCMLLLAALFGAHFVNCVNAMHQGQQVATQTYAEIGEELERNGLAMAGLSPMEEYDEDGYNVTGKIGDISSDDATVRFNINNDGVVDSVTYTFVVDVEKSARENLKRVEAYFERLHEAVARLDVKSAAPELASFGTLPKEFKEEYLSGSPYEEIHVNVSDLKGQGGADIACSYFAYDEDEMEEYDYLRPEIYISIEA